MEYVQLVLAQLPAERLEQALRPGGLLDKLDEHRNHLVHQPGFQDMRVVRSINRQGNVQLVVETRWADDQSLIDYETGEPTVTSILEQYRDMLVPGSLQVIDLEALRSEEWWRRFEAEQQVRERTAFPFIVPAIAFLFGVLVVYGLSRIYLELAHWRVGDVDMATPLALGISALILLAGWFVASRPQIKAWQVGGMAAVVLLGILAGAIWAAVHEEGGAREAAAEQPPAATAPAGGGGGAGGGAPATGLEVRAVRSLRFNSQQLVVAANQPVTITFINEDTGQVHDFTIWRNRQEAQAGGRPLAGTEFCTAPCQETLNVTLAPGNYYFNCTVHPQQMTGTLVAR